MKKYKAAITMYNKHIPPLLTNPRCQLRISSAYQNLGLAYQALGQLDLSAKAFKAGIALHRKIETQHPTFERMVENFAQVNVFTL